MFKKLADGSHFSSDFKFDSLVFANTNGSIYLVNPSASISHIDSGNLKKHVKFYPPDNLVFTTTDSSGLAVYDTQSTSIIFKYKNESLNAHTYSDNYNIATSGSNNIKFYDLKCRYQVSSIINSGNFTSKNLIEWIDTCVYLFDGNNIKIFDVRNSKLINSIQEVDGFTVLNGKCYFTKKEGESKFLYRFINNSYTRKQTNFNKLVSLSYQKHIAQISKNSIRFEDETSFKDVFLNFKNVEYVDFGCRNGFLVADESLYFIETDFHDFIDKWRIVNSSRTF